MVVFRDERTSGPTTEVLIGKQDQSLDLFGHVTLPY